MTTIAWDGKTLAADKQASCGQMARTTTKIWKINGCLVGGAGRFATILEMREWFRAGAIAANFPPSQRKEDDGCDFWVVEPSGRILKFEESPIPLLLEDKFFACGSGRDFATAALALGFDAAHAVAIACRFDTDSGGGIDTLTLDGNNTQQEKL